jgi:transposase
MSKRLSIKDHLSVEELEARYRASKDPVERSHYQIICLLAQGRPSEEVASITGYSRSRIYELVWGYNRAGVASLGDKRHEHPGTEPLLSTEQQEQLRAQLQEKGKKWSGAKVAIAMAEMLGRPVSRQRGWEYLNLLRAPKKEVPISTKREKATISSRPRRVKVSPE